MSARLLSPDELECVAADRPERYHSLHPFHKLSTRKAEPRSAPGLGVESLLLSVPYSRQGCDIESRACRHLSCVVPGVAGCTIMTVTDPIPAVSRGGCGLPMGWGSTATTSSPPPASCRSRASLSMRTWISFATARFWKASLHA